VVGERDPDPRPALTARRGGVAVRAAGRVGVRRGVVPRRLVAGAAVVRAGRRLAVVVEDLALAARVEGGGVDRGREADRERLVGLERGVTVDRDRDLLARLAG